MNRRKAPDKCEPNEAQRRFDTVARRIFYSAKTDERHSTQAAENETEASG
jgi:hypothetical protein